MSLLQGESLFIGLKEGIKLLLILYLTSVFLFKEKKAWLFFSVVGGFLLVLATVSPLGLQFIGAGLEESEVVVKLMGYSFGIFYVLSLFLLYQYSLEEPFKHLGKYLMSGLFLFPFILVLTVLYFLPDVMGTVLYIKEMMRLLEGYSSAVSFSIGILFAILILLLVKRAIAEMAIKLFDLPQFILFLSLVKLFAGGIKGYVEFSLIPTVQAGIMKWIHDIVHQTFVTIMVPDHMILKVTTWNFINIFFGDQFALYVSLIVLFIPLFIFIIRYIRAPVIPPEDITSMAERRRYIKRVRDRRFLKGLPVMVFMVVILFIWFSHRENGIERLYNPESQPVVIEDDEVVIPISSPASNLRDGMLHKFAIDLGGELVRIIVMKKKGGELAVCLDACEICPPEGYAQAEGHLVCLYCRTPIPIDTLGRPGGCNPIPLEANITDRDVRISLFEISKKWQLVKTEKTLEVLR